MGALGILYKIISHPNVGFHYSISSSQTFKQTTTTTTSNTYKQPRTTPSYYCRPTALRFPTYTSALETSQPDKQHRPFPLNTQPKKSHKMARGILSYRFKLPIHVVEFVLIHIILGVSAARLFLPNMPRTRANTMGLGFVSLLFFFTSFLIISTGN